MWKLGLPTLFWVKPIKLWSPCDQQLHFTSVSSGIQSAEIKFLVDVKYLASSFFQISLMLPDKDLTFESRPSRRPRKRICCRHWSTVCRKCSSFMITSNLSSFNSVFRRRSCSSTGRLFRQAGLGTWTCSIVSFGVFKYLLCIFTVFADAFASSLSIDTVVTAITSSRGCEEQCVYCDESQVANCQTLRCLVIPHWKELPC